MKILILLLLTLFIFGNSQVIQVKDQFSGSMIYYKPVTKYSDGSLIVDKNIDNVIYIKINQIFYQRVFTETKVSVKWFGAKGDGENDDSEAVQKALDCGFAVYFPPGIYKINTIIKKHIVIEGSGINTILKPFNPAKAIFLYRTKQPFWSYANEISNLLFESSERKGIAVAFGNVNFQEKQKEDEYASNVTFYNVNFKNFDKAVFFPFGNIGNNFYNCSFQNNSYGVYALNNKVSGDIMHAGNKYFYGCEFSSNNVGVFVHNSAIGFGGISFNDVIFQFNEIHVYIYSDNTYTPVQFVNCWDEKSASNKKVLIDEYLGAKQNIKSVIPFGFYFEGKNSIYNFFGGRINNLKINGENITVNAYSSKVESSSGMDAKDSEISENSYFNIINSASEQGIQIDKNIHVKNKLYFPDTSLNMNIASINHRTFLSDEKTYKFENAKVLQNLKNFEENTFTGSLDSFTNKKLKPNIEFEFDSKQQYMRIEESILQIPKGYYMINFDLKLNKGQLIFLVWDRNKNQLMSLKPILDGAFHNYTGIVNINSTTEIFIDISSNDGRKVDFELKNYKILQTKTYKDLISLFEQ